MAASTEQIIKAKRWRSLVTSLAALRTPEKADVMLVCGNKEFPAHRIILEASSPYFVARFNGACSIVGSLQKLDFTTVDPDSLEAILEFIYLGDVNKIKTEEELKRVAKASQLLMLNDLCQYCFHGLAAFLTNENFFDIFEIFRKYDIKKIKLKVLYFWIANATKLVASDEFLRVSAESVKELLNFLRFNHSRLDVVLVGLLRWLCHDLKTRELFVDELFSCIDARLVSKNCVRLLIKDEAVLSSSANVVKKVVKLEEASNLYDDTITISKSNLKTLSSIPWATILTFFSDYRIIDVYEPSNKHSVKMIAQHKCIQQFDVSCMMWLPVRKNLKFENGSSWNYSLMCQYGQCVYMIGGIKGLNGSYDIQNNVYKHIVYANFSIGQNAKLCYFKGHLYAVGYCESKKIKNVVHYSKPGCSYWREAQPLNFFQTVLKVLASSEHLYVIGYMTDEELVVQYNCDPAAEGNKWKIICIQKSGLDPEYFFVLNNTLHFLYCVDGAIKHFMYNHKTATISQLSSFNSHMCNKSGRWKPLPLSNFQNYESPFVFFSKPEDRLCTPAFVWEPDSNVWSILPSHQGQCEVPNDPSIKMLYTVCNV